MGIKTVFQWSIGLPPKPISLSRPLGGLKKEVMTVKWEDVGEDWRNARAEVGDYLLLMKGIAKYHFAWAVFYKHEEIVSSDKNNPCRSSTEAKRIAETVYKTAKHFEPTRKN